MSDPLLITVGQAVFSRGANADMAAPHPRSPLSPAEIAAVVDIVRGSAFFDANSRFETIELFEPSKSFVRDWTLGQTFARAARVNLFSADAIGVTRLTVSITDSRVLSNVRLPDQRAMIQLEQFMVIEDLIRADPRFIAGCAARDITDMSMVCIDPWSAGNFDIAGEEGRHICHVFAWLRLFENDNFYAHPIEGLNAVIDLKTSEILRVDDYGVVPVPMTAVNYEAQFQTSARKSPKPIDVELSTMK